MGPNTEEQAFPLQRQFRRHILPLLLAAVVVLAGLVGWSTLRLTSDLYLEGARQYAMILVSRLNRDAPDAWQAVAMPDPRSTGLDPAQALRVHETVATFLGEERLSRLKIFDRYGRILFSADPAEVGTFEVNAFLQEVSRTGEAAMSLDGEDGQSDVYDAYVPITAPDGTVIAVMELFEATAYVNPLLLRTMAGAVLPPSLLLLALVFLLARLVGRAQREIDSRSTTMMVLKRRLESFVSTHAIGAVATADGDVASRVMDATLLYSDIVDFTGYSENHPPQQVVSFLNEIMTLQVEVIRQYGGDVDKMIGDAVLAVFEGTDRAARGIACGQAILQAMRQRKDLPRGVRLGLHDGYVIAGAIGPVERRDFTVIGDSVNVTARLCGLAADGELVTDSVTVARAGHPADFSTAEELMVKGRSEPVRVRRWVCPAP